MTEQAAVYDMEELTAEQVSAMSQEDCLRTIAEIGKAVDTDNKQITPAVMRSFTRLAVKVRGTRVASNPRATKTAKAAAKPQYSLDNLLKDL